MTKASLLELLKSGRQQRYRDQTGTIVERSDGFYIRYYKDGDGGERTKVTERLCDLSTPEKKRTLLQRSHMSAVNNARHTALKSPTAEPPALTVGAFWQTTYLPWVKANKRFSTIRGYETTWKIYVKPYLETIPMKTFTTVDACDLLDMMVTKKNLNENTLAHVKSLCSGIFSKACRTKDSGISVNPWREAKESVRVKKAKPRVKYTQEETATILNALNQPDAKLFFALCAVLALRPEEAAAVRWDNIDLKAAVLKVREAAPYGKLGELKTERSKRDLTIIEPVLTYVKAWHQVMVEPKTGFLFTSNGADPVNSNNFARYRIAPTAKKVCARWCGLYSGRHGAATRLFNLTGDARAAYQVLGNSLAVVTKTYVEPDTEAGAMGLGMMSDALSKELVAKATVRK
jgi:integrase